MKNDLPASGKSRGRPLSFDRDAALQEAMHLFWRQGYEATSISGLTAVMGITAPSLYAAFGDKEQLFLEAIECYANGPGNAAALFARGTTARATVLEFMESNARELTNDAHPRGCMVVAAAVNGSAGSAGIQQQMLLLRQAVEAGLRTWMERGMASGELPTSIDPAALAKYYYAVAQGMTLQARDGATTEQLLAVARLSMQAWPSPPTRNNKSK